MYKVIHEYSKLHRARKKEKEIPSKSHGTDSTEKYFHSVMRERLVKIRSRIHRGQNNLEEGAVIYRVS